MTTVKEIAARIAAEDGPAAWPTRAQRDRGLDETEVVAPQKKSKKPNRKINAAAVAGAVTALIMFVLGRNGIELDAETASAITAGAAALLGYAVPEKG